MRLIHRQQPRRDEVEAREYSRHVTLLKLLYEEGGEKALGEYCSQMLQTYVDRRGRNMAETHTELPTEFLGAPAASEEEMPRQIKRTEIKLNDRLRLHYLPLAKPKGRHVLAMYTPDLCRGELLVGVFKTWQLNRYIRQPRGSYGKGGGRNTTVMHRESWVLVNGEKVPTDADSFSAWKRDLLEHEIMVVKRG